VAAAGQQPGSSSNIRLLWSVVLLPAVAMHDSQWQQQQQHCRPAVTSGAPAWSVELPSLLQLRLMLLDDVGQQCRLTWSWPWPAGLGSRPIDRMLRSKGEVGCSCGMHAGPSYPGIARSGMSTQHSCCAADSPCSELLRVSLVPGGIGQGQCQLLGMVWELLCLLQSLPCGFVVEEG